MSDTPRTDAELKKSCYVAENAMVVSAKFARQLERELIKLKEGIEQEAERLATYDMPRCANRIRSLLE